MCDCPMENYFNSFTKILLFPQPTQQTLQLGGSLTCQHTNNAQVYTASPVCARMISSLGTYKNTEKYESNKGQTGFDLQLHQEFPMKFIVSILIVSNWLILMVVMVKYCHVPDNLSLSLHIWAAWPSDFLLLWLVDQVSNVQERKKKKKEQIPM